MVHMEVSQTKNIVDFLDYTRRGNGQTFTQFSVNNMEEYGIIFVFGQAHAILVLACIAYANRHALLNIHALSFSGTRDLNSEPLTVILHYVSEQQRLWRGCVDCQTQLAFAACMRDKEHTRMCWFNYLCKTAALKQTKNCFSRPIISLCRSKVLQNAPPWSILQYF